MHDQLAHYKILDWIGSGRMGEVCRARDTKLGRTVAIKVLPGALGGDPERRERLLQGARAASALSHPNIAALYEIGEDAGDLFLVFEFVPGEPLSRLIAGRPLNPRRAVHIAVQVADALADAHAADVVHAGIEPKNILITPKGNAKLIDFGLAAWNIGTSTTTPYMSPEQARGEAVDERSDVFSLGVVLYEMLTGSVPFQGTGSPSRGAASAPVAAPPSTVNRDVPPSLDPIIARALDENAASRFESAAALAGELRAVGEAIQHRQQAQPAPRAGPQTRVERTPPRVAARPSRRSRASLGWVAALLFIGAAGAAWYERGCPRPPHSIQLAPPASAHP